MARASSNFRPGVLLLALVIAVFLWGVAQESTSIRQEFNVPIEIHGVADSMVVTEQTAQSISIAITGTRAALRNLDERRLKYEFDVSKAKPGMTEFDVDRARIRLPSRARFVNHSPTKVRVRLEKKERKQVTVVADVQGQPAEGFELAEVRVVPDRVWVEGARSQVNRLPEITTEPIDVAGLRRGGSREVSVILRGANVWLDGAKLVTVQLVVEPVPPPTPVDTTADAEEGEAPVPADGGEPLETLGGLETTSEVDPQTADASPASPGSVGVVTVSTPLAIGRPPVSAQQTALAVPGTSPVAAQARSTTNTAVPVRATAGEGS